MICLLCKSVRIKKFTVSVYINNMYKRKFYFCSHLLFKPRRRKMNLSLDLQLPFKLPIKDGQKIISGYNGEKFVAIFNTHSNPTLIIESGEPPAEEERSEERRVGKECRSGWWRKTDVVKMRWKHGREQ